MSKELKPAAVHYANVFLPGSLGPVRREVVLAYEHDRVVEQLRSELAAANEHMRDVTAERYEEQAELAVLKAGQGEAVYLVPVTGSLDEIDAQVWPFINEEARKVGAEHGRIETYKYERVNGGVAVLWNANRIHAMAVTIRDDMNRTSCIRMLTAPPASADAVSVQRELLDSLVERYDAHTMIRATMSRIEELRALLAQSKE